MKADPKLPRGVSDPAFSSRRPLDLLAMATVGHVAGLVILASWAFGGNSAWARVTLSVWGSFSILLTLHVLRDRDGNASRLRPLRWLWPLGLLVALVVASLFNPSFREVQNGAETVYVEGRSHPHWPSTAVPARSLQNLWFFAAVYLSCFNLVLLVRQRRALRVLLLLLAGNALVLAVFGTAQKLVGATGLFFGAVKSPQVHFFASFIYHNHWGAFAVVMTAMAVGLTFHFSRRQSAHGPRHSPATAGLVAVMLLATSVPLSTSRSCTILMLVLLGGALAHWLVSLVRQRRAYRESVVLPVSGALVAAGVIGAFALYVSRPVVEARVAKTYAQIAEYQARTGPNSRLVLYRDTWRMAREKIGFGWGMGSYATVFFHRNSQRDRPDGFKLNFQDAHSDWLQSVAELGLAGTGLLGLCALVPLHACRRSLSLNPVVIYPLAGCAILLLYAWVEFPFGNRAVVCAWWCCFFAALQYARLSERPSAPSASSGPPPAALAVPLS